VLNEALKTLKITEKELREFKLSEEPKKKVVVWFLRKHTLMTHSWIMEHCGIGNRTSIYLNFKEVEESKAKNIRTLKRKLTD
jgi:hypothetical protein